MTDGRTIWRAKDALWHEREWIVTLVDEFGPAGYAVIDYLEAQAKMQNDGGRVKAGPRAVARATGADVVTVGHVLSRSVTLGLLDEWQDRDGRFTCRIVWFVADQGRAMAANRKARQRDGDPLDKGDPPPLSRSVTLGHGESRSVTECPPTGQDSTEVNASAKADACVAASPPLSDERQEVEDRVLFLCRLMSDEVRSAHGIPDSSREARPVKSWHDACRSMLTRDGYRPDQVEFAIRWVCRHHYWRRRVKSMTRLRSEMGQVAKEIREQREHGANVHPLRPHRQNADEILAALEGASA